MLRDRPACLLLLSPWQWGGESRHRHIRQLRCCWSLVSFRFSHPTDSVMHLGFLVLQKCQSGNLLFAAGERDVLSAR